MAPSVDLNNVRTFFKYDPSLGAAILFAVLFGLLALLLSVQIARKKSYFVLFIVLQCWLQVGGYIGRALIIQSIGSIFYGYIVSLLLVLLAPNLLGLGNYLAFSRMAQHGNLPPSNFWKRHPRIIPIFFVGSDFLCLLIQGVGASQLATGPGTDAAARGEQTMLAGLCAQLIFVGIFLLIAFSVSRGIEQQEQGQRQQQVRSLFHLMMLSMTLLMLRNLYRSIEFSEGYNGALAQNEASYYLCDALLMFLSSAAFCCFDLSATQAAAETEPTVMLMEVSAKGFGDSGSVIHDMPLAGNEATLIAVHTSFSSKQYESDSGPSSKNRE